jgi:hypothetical protein
MADEAQSAGDAGFVSGPWTGYYAYLPQVQSGQHRMDLNLSFQSSRVDGDGIDDVGGFTIRGVYGADTRDCRFVKSYRSHQVNYRGTQQGHTIRGRWDIGPLQSGTFCIWPKAYGELTGEFFVEHETVEPPLPLEREAPATTARRPLLDPPLPTHDQAALEGNATARQPARRSQ